MAYRDAVLSVEGGQIPEIWFEFNPNDGFGGLDGSGYGDRGDREASGALASVSGTGGLPNGEEGYGTVTGGQRLRSGNGNFTFAMFDTSTFGVWVRTTDTTGPRTVWNFNTSSGSSTTGYIRLDIMADGKPAIRGGSSTTFVQGPNAVNDGNWHFIVFRRLSGTTGDLWVDGVNVGTASSSSLTENISGYLWFGDNGYTAYGNNFIGDIAHLTHHPGRLTDANIQHLWTAGNTRAPKNITLDEGGTHSFATLNLEAQEVTIQITTPPLELEGYGIEQIVFDGGYAVTSITNPHLFIEVDSVGEITYSVGDTELTIVNPPMVIEVDTTGLIDFTAGDVELTIITPPMYLEVDAGTVEYWMGEVEAIPLGPPIEITTDAFATVTYTGADGYEVTFTEATLPVQIRLDVEFTRGVIKNRLTSNLYDAKMRRAMENTTLVLVNDVWVKMPRPVESKLMKEIEKQ